MRMALLEEAQARHLVITHHDITGEHQARERAQEQAELLNAVGAAVTVTDLEGIVRHWSDGAESMYGWSAAEVVGQPLTMVTVVPEARAAAAELLCSTGDDGRWEGQLDVCHRDGRRFPADVRNRLLRDTEGRPTGIIGISVDVTERVAMERRLRGARDFHDVVLQTVPNGLFVLDATGCVTLVNEAAETLLGWRQGDLLGVTMHDTIQSITADGAPRPAAHSAILQALDQSSAVRVEDDAFQRHDGTFLEVAYSAAPFTSEAGERGAVVVFDDITERKARELRLRRELDALTWVGRIREALRHDRLVLYAQPIVDIASGRTVQHELLLRMIGADGEVIAPGEFLPAAEEHGLIREIDRRVFQMALAYAEAGHPIEVNLSADSIGDPTLFRYVRDHFEARRIDPRLVVFEVTETALIGNEAAAQAFTQDVVALGCSVALDDFGTGFGGFRYLKHLPVSLLKIDREFVGDCDGEQGAASRHVINAIVSLARGMGKTTVAEGVETEAALAVIRELGVDTAQGYLFARPAPADEVLRSVDQGG